MKQAILIDFDWSKELEEIRKKYVHYSNKVKPHITLIYVFENKNQIELKEHITSIANEFNSFEINLNKLGKSKKDYYLYLKPSEGNKEILKLHKRLKSGILNDIDNPDMPKYIAHTTLGIFESKGEIDNVIKELKSKKLSYRTKIDKFQLLTFDDKFNIIKKKNFNLKG